jgi:hypothetical protein
MSLTKAIGAILLAFVALGLALHDITTGETAVVPSRDTIRSTYERRWYTVTREEDPVSFYGEVAVMLGSAAYLFYSTIAAARKDRSS